MASALRVTIQALIACELTVRILDLSQGIASPFHRGSLANRLASTGCLVATEFVAHVNAQMMHDHCDATCATAMRPEDGEERASLWSAFLASLKNLVWSICDRRCWTWSEVGQRASDRVCKRESTLSRHSCLEPALRIAAESIDPSDDRCDALNASHSN